MSIMDHIMWLQIGKIEEKLLATYLVCREDIAKAFVREIVRL